MRDGKTGLTKWLLQETHEDHDATMELVLPFSPPHMAPCVWTLLAFTHDQCVLFTEIRNRSFVFHHTPPHPTVNTPIFLRRHPYMKTIYQRKANLAAYTCYLDSQRAMFEAIEERVRAHADHPVLSRLHDPGLERAAALRSDVSFFVDTVLPVVDCTTGTPADSTPIAIGPTAGARAYASQVEADEVESVELLAVHHMLQYLAVLSGGQFLKTQLSKQLASDGVSSPAGGLSFYTFETVKVAEGSKFVSAYMDTFDQLPFTISRDVILACAKRVYASSLELMRECHALAPIVPTDDSPPAAPPQLATSPSLRLTLAELAEYDGVRNQRILISISGRLYDVTTGAGMYGPTGSYAKFAGRDVTRALGAMDLSEVALNDLDWAPESPKQAKVLADWEKKLGGKYHVCGELVHLASAISQDAKSTTKRGGASANPAATTAAEGAGACPFSGAAAASGDASSCPFASAAPAANKPAEAGECPWPFVFLHDVAGGLQPKHLWKNATAVAVVVAAAAWAVRLAL